MANVTRLVGTFFFVSTDLIFFLNTQNVFFINTVVLIGFIIIHTHINKCQLKNFKSAFKKKKILTIRFENN